MRSADVRSAAGASKVSEVVEHGVNYDGPGVIVFAENELDPVAAQLVVPRDRLSLAIDGLIDDGFAECERRTAGEREPQCAISGQFRVSAGKFQRDLTGVGAWRNNEIVFELLSIAVILEIDTRINISVNDSQLARR